MKNKQTDKQNKQTNKQKQGYEQNQKISGSKVKLKKFNRLRIQNIQRRIQDSYKQLRWSTS